MVASSIYKLFLGGSSLGIGIFGLGATFLLPTVSEKIPITKIKISEQKVPVRGENKTSVLNEDKEKLTTQPSSDEEEEEGTEVVVPQCSIYEVQKPTGSGTSRKVHHIIQKIKDDKEKFLTWEGQTEIFRREIREVCPKDMKDSINVYVWREGRYWKYSKDIQKDWLSDNKVSRSPNST